MTAGDVPVADEPRCGVPERLVEAAARVLGEEGPAALSTRRLARETGTSTMAVYTYFGGMPGLVRAVVEEGFRRLADHLTAVRHTDDPLADLAALAAAYRDNALENPQLYRVMFGATPAGSIGPPTEPTLGWYTFDPLVAGVQRALDRGVLRSGDASAIAGQLWSALHGYVLLELAGMHTADDEQRVLWPMLANLIAPLRR